MTDSRQVIRRGPRRTVKRWCAWCGNTLRSGEFCNDECAAAYAEDLGITHRPPKRGPLPAMPEPIR